jgi:hypothetical protein
VSVESSSSFRPSSWIREVLAEKVFYLFRRHVSEAKVDSQMPKVEAVFRDSGMSREQFRKWLVYAADVSVEAACRDEWMYFVGVLSNSVAERRGDMPPTLRASAPSGVALEDDSARFFESKYAHLYS